MHHLCRAIAGAALLATAILMTGCGGSSSQSPYQVSTIAGNSTFGIANGPGAMATFHNPVNVAINSQGTMYIADYDNGAIRKITTSDVVSTLTQQSDFDKPFGITFAPDGTLYVETDANDLGGRDDTTGTIWRVNTTSGAATVVARNLGRPRGLTALPDGRLVLVDLVAGTVRLMDPHTAAITNLAGTAGVLGFADLPGAAAEFNRPYGAAILPNGDILLADQNNNRLREVSLGGVVSTFAGTGAQGAADGSRLQATLNHPEDVAVDGLGNVFVDDHDNQTFRRIGHSGRLVTFAGGLPAGYKDAPGLQARFFGQEGFAITPDGRSLIVADGTDGDDTQPYSKVRKISL